MYTSLLYIALIVVLLSLIFSIIAIRRQQNKEMDEGIGVTTRNPVIANPIFIAYVLFPIAILIGVAILFYFLK